MTTEEVASLGFTRGMDWYNPNYREKRYPVFYAQVNDGDETFRFHVKKTDYNDTDWHVRKESIEHTVTVESVEQLQMTIQVLTNFKYDSFTREQKK